MSKLLSYTPPVMARNSAAYIGAQRLAIVRLHFKLLGKTNLTPEQEDYEYIATAIGTWKAVIHITML